MRIFTIYLEYGGGTYISQVEGSSPQDVLRRWTPKDEVALALGGAVDELVVEFRRGQITPVEGITKVWCATALANDELAMIHMVETAR